MVEKGIDIVTVSKLLGHSDIKTIIDTHIQKAPYIMLLEVL